MQILKVYPETPMYFSHPGLLALLHKDKVKDVKEGDFYVFINRACTSFKVVTGNGGNVIVYYKSPSKSRRIDIDALKYIPHYFGGEDAGYSKALDHSLRKRLPYLYDKQ